MKKYVSIFVLGLLPFCVRSQSTSFPPGHDPKQFQLGIGLGTGRGGNSGGYIRAAPYASYFIKYGLALRAEGRYHYGGPDGTQFMGAGLFAQYHFLRANRFSAHLQAGYFYGQTDYGRYRESSQVGTVIYYEMYRKQLTYGMFTAGLGAQFRLGSRWSINGLIEKNAGQKVSTETADRDNLTIGISYRIK